MQPDLRLHVFISIKPAKTTRQLTDVIGTLWQKGFITLACGLELVQPCRLAQVTIALTNNHEISLCSLPM
jgi:hypothetical protein